MKPGLVYYGGKQNMLPYILPLVPGHACYVEPFCGGATTLFAKKKSPVEVINDNSDSLINFYRVLQHPVKCKKLQQLCNETLYARSMHFQAVKQLKTGNEIEQAWALWFKITTGFSGRLDGGFSITKKAGSSPCRRFQNYKKNLYHQGDRLENTIIENIEALDCIDIYDSEETFFYLDPPYLNADQGHYSGYKEEDFIDLCCKLAEIKGSFLLSCYPGGVIDDYTEKHSWNMFSVCQKISARNTRNLLQQPEKTELLVWNYRKICVLQKELFPEYLEGDK